MELDGKKITLPAYALKDENGYDTNYVRVRDLAELIDGTASQFNVDWSGSVDLTPRTPYTTRNGTELKVPFSGPQPYTVYTGETKVGGAVTAFDAFTIVYNDGGHTYYKLRDLGKALGFNVGWSAERGIYIETDKDYIG